MKKVLILLLIIYNYSPTFLKLILKNLTNTLECVFTQSVFSKNIFKRITYRVFL